MEETLGEQRDGAGGAGWRRETASVASTTLRFRTLAGHRRAVVQWLELYMTACAMQENLQCEMAFRNAKNCHGDDSQQKILKFNNLRVGRDVIKLTS